MKRIEYLSEIPYIFPIPKVATAFIVDLQDEKFFILKSKSDPMPRRPDALIKNKVRCLVAKNTVPIDKVNFRTRTGGSGSSNSTPHVCFLSG